MKKLFVVIILFLATNIFAQVKDTTTVDDTTAINNKLMTLQNQYNETQKAIDEAQKRIDNIKTLQHRIEGMAEAYLEQKRELLETKYKKVIK